MANIWLAFITGLTTGGISCFAVQGGLLASSLVENPNRKSAITLFLAAKITAYTLLGFLLGFLGSTLDISPKFQGTLQIFVGFFLLATAARLLDLHPIFRYFVIQPPKSILKLLKNRATAKSFFTPLTLGFLTILIPCGVTQTMMLLAITTGNPLWGAGIMFTFTLGTSPIFFLIGLAAVELFKKKTFVYLTAGFVAVMGALAINSGQLLRGSVHTFQNYWRVATGKEEESRIGNIVNIKVTNSGYQADINTLKLGVPVKIKLTTNNVKSCARAFTIPDLNYFKILPVTGTETIEFTPTKIGTLTYTCSMGMYTGFFDVVK